MSIASVTSPSDKRTRVVVNQRKQVASFLSILLLFDTIPSLVFTPYAPVLVPVRGAPVLTTPIIAHDKHQSITSARTLRTRQKL